MKKFASVVFAMFWPAAVFCQPANFSSETGILNIPALTINGRAAYTDVELSLSDAAAGEFTLVDFDRRPDPDNGIQEFVLDFGETLKFDENTTIRFIKVLSESRCPSDVVCITSGEVTVLLNMIETVTGGNTKRTTFGLTLLGLNISVFEHNGIYFRLAKAIPYPVSTEEFNEEAYEITVEYSSLPFK